MLRDEVFETSNRRLPMSSVKAKHKASIIFDFPQPLGPGFGKVQVIKIVFLPTMMFKPSLKSTDTFSPNDLKPRRCIALINNIAQQQKEQRGYKERGGGL